jgi:hypothetical protein
MIKYMSLDKSDLINKKLVAIFYDENNKKIKTTHFGQKGSGDYTINNDDKIKDLYLNRHRKNENWNDFTSAGALSRWILWNKKTVNSSLKEFLNKFNLSAYNK